jgi:DNA-binding SARP family transcriptional activator
MSVQRVVAFLALADRPVQRLHVAGSLWLDSTEEHANACLRTALWRLGRAEPHVVDASSTQLSIFGDVKVDVHDVVRAAEWALGDDPVTQNGAYAPLYAVGELLCDWYDDWVIVERERIRQLQLRALEKLCRRMAREARYAEAVAAGLTAIGVEPLRESAHRALIETYLAEGNASDALRQYRLCRSLLERDLGVGPSPALERLVEPIGVR